MKRFAAGYDRVLSRDGLLMPTKIGQPPAICDISTGGGTEPGLRRANRHI
jgi:hypothetical protein